jgi:hypothetical protein
MYLTTDANAHILTLGVQSTAKYKFLSARVDITVYLCIDDQLLLINDRVINTINHVVLLCTKLEGDQCLCTDLNEGS